MASHVSDTWQAMCHNAWKRHACVTHGMPSVTMHGLFKAYIYGVSKSVCGEGKQEVVRGSTKEKEEEGKRGREKEKEKRRRKGRKRGKRKRKRKECCAVSTPGRQRTRNCATRGRFPPTLVNLRLGAVQWPTGFVLFFRRICLLCGLFVIV